MAEPLPIVIDTDGGVDDAGGPVVGADLAAGRRRRHHHRVGQRRHRPGHRQRLPGAPRRRARRHPGGGRRRRPGGPAPELRVPDFIHGADGLGDTNRPPAPFGAVDEPAVDLLARLVADRPGELTVVTLGPLSTVAELVLADPSWAGGVARARRHGRRGGQPRQRPARPARPTWPTTRPAPSIVVGAAWPTPPLLVGLDVTHEATLSDAEWERARPAGQPGGRLPGRAAGLLPPLRLEPHAHRRVALPRPARHDGRRRIPDLIEAPVLPLAVVTAPGPAWGATIADRRVPYFARAGEGAEQELPDGFSPWRVGLERRRRAVPGRGPRPVRRLSVVLVLARPHRRLRVRGLLRGRVGARADRRPPGGDRHHPRSPAADPPRRPAALPRRPRSRRPSAGCCRCVALRTLPLFLVQSAVAASIAVTAVVARIVLRTKLDRGDAVAIGVIVVGLVVLAAGRRARRRPTGRRAVPRCCWWPACRCWPLGAAALAQGRGRAGRARAWRRSPGLAFSGTAIAGRVVAIPDDLLEIVREPVAWALVGYGRHRHPACSRSPCSAGRSPPPTPCCSRSRPSCRP